MDRATTLKRWTVSSEAGKAAGVPLALFVALAANAWHTKIPNSLDKRIYDGIDVSGHGVIFHTARIISYSASPLGGALLTLLIAALVWWKKRDLVGTLAVFLSSGSAAILQRVAKETIQRPRPPYTARLTGQSGFAFPSGHAAGISALVTVVALLIVAKRLPVRQPNWSAVALISFGVLVAFTRLLVGAHYFTDAAAGLALGTAIACLVTAALPLLDRIYARFRPAPPEPKRSSHPSGRTRQTTL